MPSCPSSAAPTTTGAHFCAGCGSALAALLQGVELYSGAWGVDDDFPVLWQLAVDSPLTAEDLGAARRVTDIAEATAPALRSSYLTAALQVAQARVAVAEGRDDALEADLRAGQSALVAFGAPYDTALACAELGRWLMGQGRTEEAVPLLAQARAGPGVLGATPALARLDAHAPDALATS